jgi:hypothetical protein
MGVDIIGHELSILFLKSYMGIQSAVPTVRILINHSEIYWFIYTALKLVSTLGGH